MIDFARRLVAHRLFKGLIVAMILLAGVLAGVETSPRLVSLWGPWLGWLNHAVLAIFTAEIALKLTAYGRAPQTYFADGWNVFDCVVVGLCFLPAVGPYAALLRLSRVLRLLRLVSTLPKLQLLVGALLKSLSSMGYVSLLLALIFYIYAVAGVHLFGRADPVDFGSLPAALLTLFRVVTLDNWGDVFARVYSAAPGLVVALYFVTFIVLGTMIILNLFIGIVMNSMAEMHRELEDVANETKPAAPLAAELLALERQLAALRLRVQSADSTAGGPEVGLDKHPPPGKSERS